eukprot:Skav218312  [mRNA]  locus=scaffold2388:319282:320835:- [translate_table: standard]
MASLITKDPLMVVELATHLWHFLAGTIHHGLVFQNQQDEKELRVFTDASFNDTCQGCVLVFWGESLLLWKSSRQPVVTVSTAECELVEIMEGVCSGEAIRVVMEEMLSMKVRSITFTDSSSALAIISGDSGSWRTRHLRKRAQALRNRVLCADWLIRHLPGKEMPADIGTKILAKEKFDMLKRLMGMVATSFVEDSHESTSTTSNSIDIEKALKLVIVIAQIGLAKGQMQNSEDGEDRDSLEEHAERDPWSWSFVVMVWFILLIVIVLVMIGAVVVVRWLWCKRSTTSIQIVSHESQRENSRKERSSMDRNGEEGEDTSTPSANVEVAVGVDLPRRRHAAAAASRAVTAASSGVGTSLNASAAEADLVRLSAPETDASAALALTGAAAAEHGASAAAEIDASAACAFTGAAAAEHAASAAAGEVSGVAAGSGTSRVTQVFVTETGSKYHVDRLCRGLRIAGRVLQSEVCQDCGSLVAGGDLWTENPGDLMHSRSIHARHLSSQSHVIRFQPCKICSL